MTLWLVRSSIQITTSLLIGWLSTTEILLVVLELLNGKKIAGFPRRTKFGADPRSDDCPEAKLAGSISAKSRTIRKHFISFEVLLWLIVQISLAASIMSAQTLALQLLASRCSILTLCNILVMRIYLSPDRLKHGTDVSLSCNQNDGRMAIFPTNHSVSIKGPILRGNRQGGILNNLFSRLSLLRSED